MSKGMVHRTFIYFLCFSFLLLTGGFPRMAAEAAESGLPIGEMTSSGVVKFEARENVWKEVEPTHFPVFQGVRIKTEKGQALIVLAEDIRIEVGQNSLFSFQQDDQLHLLQGRAFFRIPSGADMTVRVANVFIGKPLPLQATKSQLVSPRSEETIGSITVHPNGAVTVKTIRGPLSIQNEDRVVLAALSPKESVTIPSVKASGDQGQIVAQIGEYPTGTTALEEPFLGLSGTTWVVIGLGTVAATGAGIAIAASDDDDDRIVVCP
ncbi:MAG: hypothetical protein GTO13_18340 [Proteobacteria bacterium]|nr:hypothetical protein [Pseudomonadota bacterium]